MPQTDQQRFIDMLIGAQIDYTECTTPVTKTHMVELDNGDGAIARFEFSTQGILLTFEIDPDAY